LKNLIYNVLSILFELFKLLNLVFLFIGARRKNVDSFAINLLFKLQQIQFHKFTDRLKMVSFEYFIRENSVWYLYNLYTRATILSYRVVFRYLRGTFTKIVQK